MDRIYSHFVQPGDPIFDAATRRFCAQCGAPLPSPCPTCGEYAVVKLGLAWLNEEPISP
jgi:hypothetical protein